MPLNIKSSRTSSDPSGPAHVVRTGDAAPTPAEELLDELTNWGARDRLRMFAAWHRGSLSIIHLTVLALLESEGPLSMGRVAEALDVSQASATGIIDRMEERGLVERRRGEGDRRVVAIHLADGGRAISRDLMALRRERLSHVLAELTPREVSGFLLGIRAMRRARERLVAVELREAGGSAR